MTLKEFFEQTLEEQKISGDPWARSPRPRVCCKDEFTISIQANRGAYCHPRANDRVVYREVELGYPNKIDELIEPYSEDPGSTDTVYGYVPVKIVEQLLEKHGGIEYYYRAEDSVRGYGQ